MNERVLVTGGAGYTKKRFIVSNAKLEPKGWRPHHGRDAGIRELIKGYQMSHNEIYSNV